MMTKSGELMNFSNAEIRNKANIYNDGQVSSRSIVTSDGESKTLGVMLLGSYVFNTAAAELMELVQGHCRVKLADEDEWRAYREGQSFEVPANASFDIEVLELLDYICHFEVAN
jgi:hypothetical protein